MPLDWIINTFTTLFVIIDPIGIAPIFVVLTQNFENPARRSIAIFAVATAFCILTFFALVGATLLASLGISLAAFKIAGGLFLFWTAFEMVFEKRVPRKKASAEKIASKDEIRAIAIFPLSIPLLAGPGAISATVLLAAKSEDYGELGLLIAIIGIIMGTTLMTFLAAGQINKVMGEAGRVLLGRLLGVLLAALSVQFIIDGIKSAFIPA